MRLYYNQKKTERNRISNWLPICPLKKTPRNKNALKIYMVHQHTCHVDRIEFNISVPLSSGSSLSDTTPALWGRAVRLKAWVSLVLLMFVGFAGAAIVVWLVLRRWTRVARIEVESPIVGDGRGLATMKSIMRSRGIRPERHGLVLRSYGDIIIGARRTSLVQARARRLSHVRISAIRGWRSLSIKLMRGCWHTRWPGCHLSWNAIVMLVGDGRLLSGAVHTCRMGCMIVGLTGAVSICDVVIITLVGSIVVLIMHVVGLVVSVESLGMSVVALFMCAIWLLLVGTISLVMSSKILLLRPIALIMSVVALIVCIVGLVMCIVALIMPSKSLIVSTISLIVSSVWASSGLLAVRVHVTRRAALLPIVRIIPTHGPLLLLLLSSEPRAVHVLSWRLLLRRQSIHFDLLFQHNLLGVGCLPARHGREGIGIMLGDVKFGILRRSMRRWCRESRDRRVRWRVNDHGCLLSVSSGLLRNVWRVELFACRSAGSIAASAAVTATLEAVAATAAA